MSVRFPAAQPGMTLRSPGSSPSTHSLLNECVGLVTTGKTSSHQGRVSTEDPSHGRAFFPLLARNARCGAARCGAARLPCVTGNTGGSGAHHTSRVQADGGPKGPASSPAVTEPVSGPSSMILVLMERKVRPDQNQNQRGGWCSNR